MRRALRTCRRTMNITVTGLAQQPWWLSRIMEALSAKKGGKSTHEAERVGERGSREERDDEGALLEPHLHIGGVRCRAGFWRRTKARRERFEERTIGTNKHRRNNSQRNTTHTQTHTRK